MILGLHPIPLQELRALSAPKIWDLADHTNDFIFLTGVRGKIKAELKGNTLRVTGKIQTLMRLYCDRCLSIYNHLLTSNTEELIWLGEQTPNEEHNKWEMRTGHLSTLMECLDPLECFEPERWAFEQLSLQLPLSKNYGLECQGRANLQSSIQESSKELDSKKAKPLRPRWGALEIFHLS